MRFTEIEAADVWRGSTLVGTITRARRGAAFEYTDDFHAAHKDRAGGIATHLPYRIKRVETHGVNLHTFFAGLLPEGLRLRALEASVKTSGDDLLSLLIAAGSDTIGDIAVVPQGAGAPSLAPESSWLPEEVLFAELFSESLRALAQVPTLSGVQEKISASTISFPIAPRGRRSYILKLNPADKPHLVENERFFMEMARGCGLEVATTHLVFDREKNPGLLVERFDRAYSKELRRLIGVHQEDACQFLDRYPADKYRISHAEIAAGIQETAAAPIPELARYLEQIAFSYLIANGDLHAKNVSLIAGAPGGGLRLAPAYDLLSTLPYGDRHLALRFDGRDDNLRRSHLRAFGERFGVRVQALDGILDALVEKAAPWIERLDEIGLGKRKTDHLARVMRKRLNDLAAT